MLIRTEFQSYSRTMTKAYVETTILTNILLKPGSAKQSSAKAALARYDSSLLPVYSIKEWKAGPLKHFAYFHNKLVTTKSLADTIAAVNSLAFTPYKKSTSFEALEAAVRLDTGKVAATADFASRDAEVADRYRLAVASLIMRSWKKRRRVATSTIQDLACYAEAEPRIGSDKLFDLKPEKCDPSPECSLAQLLKQQRAVAVLKALRKAIPETSNRKEDRDRRKVLKQLINTPKLPLDRDSCRALGDAIFAFFCPDDAVILTTNLRDHEPLAKAVGKRAEGP